MGSEKFLLWPIHLVQAGADEPPGTCRRVSSITNLAPLPVWAKSPWTITGVPTLITHAET